MKPLFFTLALTFTLAGSFAGAAPLKVAPIVPGALKVATSFSILEDLVKNVGGNRVEITNFVPHDGDAHTYEPGTQDVKNLADAKLVFINGAGLEAWFQKLVKNSGTNARVIVTSAGIKPSKFQDDGQIVDDPHMWWNPQNTIQYVQNIARALSGADVANAATYKANALNYTRELEKLDAWARTQITTIPPRNRKLVTNHDAFNYFAHRYGLKIVGLVMPSVGTERDPSARETAQLVDMIRRENIRAIFTENVISPKLAQSVSKETGVKIAPPLYSDALGAVGSSGETYLKMFRHNVTTIVKALK